MRNYLIPILSFILAIIALPAAAQNCGCEEEGNCPQTIAPVQQSTVCYTFTDAFNNDLSATSQGVCGVNLNFTHDYLWDLELTLVSPSGQEVMLVGPDTMGTGGTLFTSWDISYVPCTDIAEPATGFNAIWNNAQAWPFIGLIGGSYYPVGGACLEEFDAGPVNGEWCISFNSLSAVGGTIIDFEVVLCDESGIFCCDADAGDIDGGIETCEGDESLLLNIIPDYPNIIPDSLLYGYTYLISETGGLLLEVTDTPDLTAYPIGFYTVCGLSYDLLEIGNLPQADGATTLQNIRDDLDGLNPSICAQISEDCFPVDIYEIPTPFVLTDSICLGENYIIGDSTFTEAGNYEVFFNSIHNCDSLVNLELLVLTIDTAYITETICLGDSLVVSDSTFFETGMYEVNLAGASFCDSIYVVDLTVINPVIENLDITICEGENFQVGSIFYNMTGIYADTITAISGCDSIINLDLEVISVNAQIAFPDTINCLTPIITLDGSASSSEASTTYEWTSSTGGILIPPLNTPNVQVSSGGVFQLKINRFDCSDSISVTVIQDVNIPISDAGLLDSITCNNPTVQLNGTNSTISSDLEYHWFTDDGLIPIGEENILTPNISVAPATYCLSVLNPLTGCADTSCVFIDLYNANPTVDAGIDMELTCLVDTIFLDGSSSYVDNNFSYIWTDENNIILPETNPAESYALNSGVYYFTITNLISGCQAVDSMEIVMNVNLPIVEAGETDTLTCLITEINLSGEVQNSNDYSIEWTGNGLIENETSLTPTIHEAGSFYLTITDNINSCEVIDSVLIEEDVLIPNIDASNVGFGEFDCARTSINIGNEANTSLGDEFSYSWVFNNVEISTEFPLEVFDAGSYALMLTNNSTGCMAFDTVILSTDTIPPMGFVGDDVELNCNLLEVYLDGEELSSTPDTVANGSIIFAYQWYNNLGEALEPLGDDSLFVNSAGDFYLVIEDDRNSCLDTVYVSVTEDPEIPEAEAGPSMNLNCVTISTTLDGSASSTGNYSYDWTGPSGSIITNQNTLMPTVNQAGIYTLTVTDNALNCSQVDSVEVLIDTLVCAPFVEINPGFETFPDGTNGIIDCLSPANEFGLLIDTLDASNSDFDSPNVTYEWTVLTPGSIFNDDDPQHPVVTEGEYILTMTNTLLNISASDTIAVINIRDFPISDAGTGQTLICTDFENGVPLDGINSDQGAQFEYLWSTTIGDFQASDITSLTPSAYAPGDYALLVTNTSNGCENSSEIILNLLGQIPIPCINTAIQMECIDASIMIGDTCAINNPTYTFEWTATNGGEIIGANTLPIIEVQTDTSMVSSLFEVIITNTINNCSATEIVEVFTAINCYPDCVVQTNPSAITCLQDTVMLNGLGSSEGDEFSYLWEIVGTAGNFCGGENTLSPCIDASGAYRLIVTNQATGFECQSAIVFVQENSNPPDVAIDGSNNPAINCFSDIVNLNATSTDTDAYSFVWTNIDDCILTNDTLPEIDVNCEGTYTLTVTDLTTGCFNFSTIDITYDTIPPATAIVSPTEGLIGCNTPQIVLSGSGSSQGNYSWTRNGILLADETGLTYLANQEGEYCLTITDFDNGCTTTACSSLSQDNDAVFADAGENQALTCGSSSAILVGDAPSGFEFEYEWTTDTENGCLIGNPTNLTITAFCPGTYTLTVTDITTGCTGVSSVLVIDMTTPPISDAGPDMFLDCNITTVNLDGSNSAEGINITYNWVGEGVPNPIPNTSPIAEASEPGLYKLLVFNTETSCFSIDTAFIFQNVFLPEVNAGVDTVLTCDITQLVLSGENSPQNDSLSYLWSPIESINSAPNELDVLIIEPDTFFLTITNDSTLCINTDTIIVAMDTLSPIPNILAENNATINCFQDTIILDASTSEPNGALNYSWTLNPGIISPLNQAEVTITAGGSYQLLITNLENGCDIQTNTIIAQDFIEPSVLIADPDILTCAIESVELDASASQANSSFSWSGPPGIIGINEPNPMVSLPGEYFLQLTSLDNGCDIMASTIVQEDIIPPTAMANVDGTLDCIQTEVNLLGNGSSEGDEYSYLWEGVAAVSNDTILNPIANQAGLYSLIVINDNNGCQDTAMIEVISSGFPITDLNIIQEAPNCLDVSGGSITIEEVIGGNAPYYYSFNGSVFSEYDYRNYLNPGNYTIQVEDIDGCQFETIVNIPEIPELNVDLGLDLEIEIGDSLTLNALTNIPENAIDTIIWQPLPNENCPTCFEQTITPNETMNISVQITDTLGCSAKDNLFLYVIGGEESPVFVPNIFSPNNDGNNDELIVFGKSNVEEIQLFQIFDRWGTMVFESKNFPPSDPDAGWNGNFNGQAMNSQVFAWRLEYRLRSNTQPIIIWGNVTLAR